MRCVLATALFIGVLIVLHVVQMRTMKVDVVLYASIGGAVIAAFLCFAVLRFAGGLHSLSTLEQAMLLCIWLLGGYAFAISIPTVLDRSLSFYILEKIQQRGGGVRRNAMERIFIDEYVREHRLVDVRLTEQVESGTVVVRDGCVMLTPRGQRLASFSRAYRRHLLPVRRLLAGEYTDALTDPFRDSHVVADYGCGHEQRRTGP